MCERISEEIKYSPIKYIETTERGLVVITVNEADGGRYDCFLGGSLLCSYSITVDAHRYVFDGHIEMKYKMTTWSSKILIFYLLFNRCTPPHKSTDYQKIYSDWCNEFEKYKSAMKSWEKKQVVSILSLNLNLNLLCCLTETIFFFFNKLRVF